MDMKEATELFKQRVLNDLKKYGTVNLDSGVKMTAVKYPYKDGVSWRMYAERPLMGLSFKDNFLTGLVCLEGV